jgi:hypothetical protein
MSWTIPAAISKRLKRRQENPPALMKRQDGLLAMRWKAKRIQLERVKSAYEGVLALKGS